MDYDYFDRQVIHQYLDLFGADQEQWSIGDVLRVCKYFFTEYKQHRGVEHPHLSNQTIRKIIQALPDLGNSLSVYGLELYEGLELVPDSYPWIIDKYFEDMERKPNINPTISHFFSGNVRAIRYAEYLRH